MGEYYILEGKEPKIINDVIEWATKYENTNRVLQQTHIQDVFVSTVFLGLNYRHNSDEPPILFETMIFGGEHDQYQKRYCTWDEAMEGHDEACKLVVS